MCIQEKYMYEYNSLYVPSGIKELTIGLPYLMVTALLECIDHVFTYMVPWYIGTSYYACIMVK